MPSFAPNVMETSPLLSVVFFSTFFALSSTISTDLPFTDRSTLGIAETVTVAEPGALLAINAEAPLRSDFFFEFAHSGLLFKSLTIDGSFHLVMDPPKMPFSVAGLRESVAPPSSSRR